VTNNGGVDAARVLSNRRSVPPLARQPFSERLLRERVIEPGPAASGEIPATLPPNIARVQSSSARPVSALDAFHFFRSVINLTFAANESCYGCLR
jgi:hypothetical protein